MDKRFQECSLLIRLWRRRWQLYQSLLVIKYYIKTRLKLERPSRLIMHLIYVEWQLKANYVYKFKKELRKEFD